MEFSLDRFYTINRRILIWLSLFALLWMLRDFIDIIFMVFVLCYLTAPVSRSIERYARVPHYVATTAVFLGLLLLGGGFVHYFTPRIIHEAETAFVKADSLESSFYGMQKKFTESYPYLSDITHDYFRSSIPEETLKKKLPGIKDREEISDDAALKLYMGWVVGKLQAMVPQYVLPFWLAMGRTLISILFAYLISLDTTRLSREVGSLRHSRLKDFHEQTAEPVVRFANVLGRALQAQFLIACLNTLLTTIGLLFLGLPAVTALAFVVFLCSFIPVLGVFISTAPMVIVALGTGDLMLAVWVVVLILIIHTIEAYMLNPIIYGRHLRLNPVVVLIILYVGHHAFGVWGMLLGVPITHYIMHDVLNIRETAPQET